MLNSHVLSPFKSVRVNSAHLIFIDNGHFFGGRWHVTYVENELDNLASEMIPPLVTCNLLIETCLSPSMKRAAFLFKKALICIFTPIYN